MIREEIMALGRLILLGFGVVLMILSLIYQALLGFFGGLFIVVAIGTFYRFRYTYNKLTSVNPDHDHQLRLDYYDVLMLQYDSSLKEYKTRRGRVCVGHKGLDDEIRGMIYGYFPDIESMDDAILKEQYFLSPVNGTVVLRHKITSREMTPSLTIIHHSNYQIVDDNLNVISS